MIITTTDHIPNRKISEVIGIAKGNTVRAKHLGKDFLSGLTGIVGGELEEYTELMDESRNEAIRRMVRHGKVNGADAIVNVRFMASEIGQGTSEVLAYGTAVKLEEVE